MRTDDVDDDDELIIKLTMIVYPSYYKSEI